MGEVLIGGTASLLICIFLSPKFIEFLRRREFGQQIREEGPQEHHAKAGTPTMGGIIIFTAIAVPFLLLTDLDWKAIGVFGAALACALLGFADDYTKIIKRRSLGLRARTKLGVTIAISIGLWWIATEQADLPETLRFRLNHDLISFACEHVSRRQVAVRGALGADEARGPLPRSDDREPQAHDERVRV